MAIKKSDLYSSLWKSCDELRGGMDASQYKDYVLVLLFVKYVSDKYAGNSDALIHVPAGGSFSDMVAAKNNKEIGDKINIIIGRLADANDSLKGAINVADFNDEEKLGKGKEMVDRLTKLIAIFEGLDFGSNRSEGDDLLGDAYEYLMRHFATESGKSKGQFYTPAEVSRVLSMVIDLRAAKVGQAIYDPTCGSGSLLLKAHDEAKSRTGLDLALYGQEMDNATSALARMNMVLHDCPTAEIWRANTLADPYFKNTDGSLKIFDYIVANPPFSNKNWTSGLDAVNDTYHRFEYGIPPPKNGDYAFLLHILKSLKSSGKAAVILPHGVLFRGNAEGMIRARIVKQGYVKGIIGLPPNLFYGTPIPACILILDKEDATDRNGIFMIDASKGFIKDGNKNRLRAQDIHKIVDVFTRQIEMKKYARMVPFAEIIANDFNLSLPRYIDSNGLEDLQDIGAHINGCIPNRDIDALDFYWQVFPNIRGEVFKTTTRKGYSELKIDVNQIRDSIFGHTEFTMFNRQVNQRFATWKTANTSLLMNIKLGNRPKLLIETFSENLLEMFSNTNAITALIDPYRVYQKLMDYWVDTMQDDVWMITHDGWSAARSLRQITPTKDKNGKTIYRENHDFIFDKKRYRADIIPPSLIVERYFSIEKADIELIKSTVIDLEQQLEEMREENAGTDGLLFEVLDDGKITKATLASRLKLIKGDQNFLDEYKVLEAYVALLKLESNTNKKIRDAQHKLDMKIMAKYAQLTDEEIKVLIVESKWFKALIKIVYGELDRVSQNLTGRIKQLAERYANPLPELLRKIEVVPARIEEHLNRIGLLTGQIRLPGFNDEWQEKQLGDLATFHKGRGLAKNELDPFGANPCIHYGELFTRYPEIILKILSRTNTSTGVFRSITNDVLMPTSDVTPNGLATASCVQQSGVILGGDILVIRTDSNELSGAFLSYVIRQSRDQIMQLVTGTTVFHLYSSDMKKFRLSLPPIEEQLAIVKILNDVDIEVAAIGDCRDKILAIKQGMMQELLIGGIPLK